MGGKSVAKSGCAFCKVILWSKPSIAMSRRSVGGARLCCVKAVKGEVRVAWRKEEKRAVMGARAVVEAW